MHTPNSGGEVGRLEPSAEEHWQRLRRQVEWADESWLGFLFCQSPHVAATNRRLLAKAEPLPAADRRLAALLNNAGNGLLEGGDHARARQAFEQAVALNRRLMETTGETLGTLRGLSTSLNGLGNAQLEEHDVSGAGAAYQEALGLRQRVMAMDETLRWVEVLGETPQTMGEFADRLSTVATVRRELGDHGGAEAAAEEAETIRRRLKSIGVGRAE